MDTPKESLSTSSGKPDWLKALESQSWQAELIASGLAIFGSISLGPLIDSFASNLSTLFSDRVLGIMFYAIIYIYLAHAIIVVCFISHLILRIIWAGFIGLSSVYPDGVNLKNESYAKHFLEEAKAEFPDLSDYSIRLDNLCSRLFSNFCSIAIILLCVVFWIFIFIFLSEGIVYFLGEQFVKPIALFFIAILLMFSTGSYLISIGPFKESNFAKKYAYSISKYFGKALMLYAYTTVSYIMWTQRTNQSTKQSLSGFLLIMPIAFMTGFNSSNVISLFEANNFFELNATTYYANHDNYLDQIKSSIILRPIIQSKNVEEDYLELFIPKLKREEVYRLKICGEYEEKDDLEELEDKKAKIAYQEKCAEKYYSFRFNGGPVLNQEIKYIRHSHNNEKGYATYIPLDSLAKGYHILNIKTGYQNETGEFAQRVIPFYYEKR